MSDEQNLLSDQLHKITFRIAKLESRLDALKNPAQVPLDEVITDLPDDLKKSFEALNRDKNVAPSQGDPPDSPMAPKIIDITIARLNPSPDDVVIFWLPAELTHNQVNQIAASLGSVIGGRFRFIVLIRGAVDIEIVSGKPGKGKVLLPS